MRVIAGEARRLKLVTPEGNDTRPTQDRIKETLFNMLQNDVPGAIFIDVFAGSGGIGIEALSRGAKRAYFIENNIKAIKCINQNLQTTHFEDRATVLKSDVLVGLKNVNEKEAHIIFVDPPYESGLYERTFELLGRLPYVTEYTMLIAECSLDMDLSVFEENGFEIIKEKRYKTNQHVFMKKA
ncbi:MULTISPECIES: 16S rRNA (guanine(966)-N(2))-methyltransferase RsmD [unclassified Butyrivibrio]|uniref:16S rRNA (guanine(966)-N(2))-methyltransferase RsmD n=1 Tax=unclassified Butyrivibrio TaxID=2639466 RepID=UPI0003B31D4A|nr:MULTISPECIES: 16S rRNA (guanine(966)-N(2))-methyltransferase RsmD [unclassified Butyrivibrio]SEK32986.1 16S rRNA (guanine(966)-N(2))-methyltransferase RsmD [Butyrivibrio sp. ob235]